MKCVVNSFELLLYYCIVVSMVFWVLYKNYEAQTEIFSENPFSLLILRGISSGWTFLDREKDITDTEWNCWKYYIQKSWFYLLIQFLVSDIIRNYTSALKYWYILSSLFFISLTMGAKHLIMILIQPLLYFMLLFCGANRIIVWVWSLVLLVFNHLYLWVFLDAKYFPTEIFDLVSYGIMWTELRCISYCLDFIERQEKAIEPVEENQQENVLQIFTNMFSYVLYLPVLFIGPIILYGDFENSFQNKSQKLWTRLKRFAVDITIFAIYSFLLELALHFMYFNAMKRNIELVKLLPSSALIGAGLWMSFEFYIKYVIIYGTSSAFARLDHVDAPPTPRCIARIHVYSDLWRYFDVGLYKFVLKYIYMPCYNILSKYQMSQHICKLMATISIFGFVIFWHGVDSSIIIWCILNFSALVMEHIAKTFSTTSYYKKIKDKVLKTDAMEVRMIASVCAPLLILSAISCFYFCGGTEVGHLFFRIFACPAPHNIMLLILGTYSVCQVSISLLGVPSRTDRRAPRVNVG